MSEMLDLLLRGGPWTVVVVLGFVVRHLYAELRAQSELHAKNTQQLNDRIVSAVEKQITLLQTSNEQRRALMRTLDKEDA